MTESFKPALLERLEPRILLSGDGLPIAPTPQSFQDTIDGTQQVIERKAFIEVDESVEQQFLDVKGGFCLEVDPSDQYDPALFPPMVTLSVEEGNALEESEVDDVKIDFVDGFNEISFVEANGDIGTQLGDSSSTPQDTCGLTVVAETAISQEVTTNSLYIAVENKSTPIHENNADSSNEFSTSIKVRGPPTEIVFVDSELKHDFELKNDVFSDVRLFMLPADGDGIQFISDVLSRYENLSAVHIVTHGAPGKIVLGDEILDIGSISRYSDSLSTWRNALTPVGDILFYGCSVGAGQVGRHFVQQIAAITGADMAFSNDPTGNVDFGGDWVLERNTGPIEATLPLAAETLADFDALLCITSGDANVIDASKDDAENSNSVNDITGLVWHDLYRSPDHLVDGIQDAGEPGLEGVTVNLLDVAGHLMVSTTADEAGVYQFTNLNSGTYIVEISPENFLYGGVLCGWYATFKDQGSDETRNCDGDRLTHRSDPINLGTGENRTDVDFGFFTTSINLTKTGPETAQAGETITYHFRVENTGDVVQHGGAHVYDPMINPTGNHRIWNGILQPGQVVEFDRLYTTTANDVGELVNTALAVGHPLCPDGVYVKNVTDTDDWTVTVTPSPFKGSIGDFIWHDLYHDPGHLVDGIQDFGEPGIGEVIVNLLDDADNLVRSTKTDTNGHYRFMNLTAGTYVVEVASENFLPGGVLEGWYATLENQSGNETIDSDGDPTTYRSDPIILTTDELNTNVNFGFFTTGIDLTKTGPDTAQAGETITYHFRVENTGDVVQDGGAQVYDPMLNPDGNHRIWDGVLQPGQVVEFDWMYTTTANEVGELVNTATASGCPIHPDGFGLPKVSDVDSWIVQVNAYTVGPVVTVDTRLTNDSTPELTGTLNDPDAVIEVIVDGNSYNAVNNGDGTWTLLDDTISPALVDGTYDVVAVATDLAGNIGTDQTIDELTIDTTAPVVTVDFMLTNDPTPELTGTVDDPDAAIEVIVDGYSYTAINLGGGYWMLIDDTIDPALADGTYDIVATATDLAGNSGSDTTIDELTVNTAAPLVTVDTLLTNDPTPELTGTVDDPAAVVDVTIDGNTYGATNNGDGTWTLPDDTIDPALADGIYNILVDATDLAGNIGTCDILALTIDTQPPLVSLELDPATDSEPIGDDQTNFEIINLIGTTEPDIVIQLYREGNLSVPVAQTASDNAGAFMFVGIPLNMGDNLFAALATDSVGNQGQVERTIVREGIILIEGSQFEVTYEYLFTVPSEPSHLSFNYDVTFDTSDDFINDAFEVALLDNNGNTLVHTIAFNRDAAFNITEGQIAQLGANTLQNGQTVQIDLTHIPADTEATLVLRLVNNDTDTATTVEIYNIEIVTGGLGTPLGVSQQIAEWSASQIVDFDHLSDVTGAVRPLYGATSFNNESSILYADLGLQNNSHFVVDGPLIAVIDHLSDPGIQILNADGLTPEGLPYFEMTHLLSNGSLEPGAGTTDFRTMAFENPSEQQFTYDLIILGHHNNAPIFVSEPDVEALPGKPYLYDAEATDLDGDTLVYSLITNPNGMVIDSITGEISWTPAEGDSDLGAYDITVWVEDGRGGSTEQRYQLNVIAPPPNRPPVFTSIPVTEANPVIEFETEPQPIDLSTWSVVQYELYIMPDANWVLQSDGTAILQTINADASILLSDFALANDRIEGTWRVDTTNDDDFIGFVFGYQDPEHFYLFDWKQRDQDSAERGMSIKVVNADSPLTGLDLMRTDGTEDRIKTLFHNTIPWADYTDYQFTLEFHPGQFTITVKHGYTTLDTMTIIDNTYTSGSFGFYNYSQERVLYSGFTQQVIPEITYRYDSEAVDPDQDTLTYSLIQAPTGMIINPSTGEVLWGPTVDQIGQHEVTIQASDGRGGIADQSYVVTVLEDPDNHAPIIVSEPVTQMILPEEDEGPGELIDARTWTQHRSSHHHGTPQWTFTENGTVVTQLNNASGSYLLSDFEVSYFELEGILRVDTGNDDDSIGLMFGFQDVNNYYLLNMRNDRYSGEGQYTKLDVRVNAISTNLARIEGISWEPYTDYLVKLRFLAGVFTLQIWDGNQLIFEHQEDDGPIVSGKIAYWLSSQARSQFKYFRIKELPAGEYTYDVEAVDADGDTLAYSLAEGPSGMTIDPESGLVEWQGRPDPGDYQVTIRVEDGRGGFDEQSYTLRVDHPADLTIAHVDGHLASFDGQLLTVTGQVSSEITNNGPGDISQPFDVLFFEDRNYNEQYDERLDSLLGKITVNSPLLAGQSTIVNADLSGFVQFSGTLIWGFVDSKDTVLELDETNNLAHSGEDCKTMPLVTGFDPVVELHKNTFSIRPGSIRIVMTPAVVDVNEDGIPDIVFITCGDRTSPFGSGYGPLRTISGDTGAELWTVMDDTYDADGYGGIAAGDIDSDGLPEIIANHMSGSLIAFEHDGTFKWQSPPYWMSDRSWGSPSLADLDGDGTVEIISGASVFNADGTIRWEGNASGGLGRGDNGSGPLSAVADLDLDGVPEVIAGRTVYRNDGSVFWDAGISDGFPGIGNFDADLYPEIVLVSQARVYLLEHTGTQVWNTPIPGGGEGGAPTIADMDGDGEPEIGVAGASNYVVFETDGSVKWQSPTSDASSRRTGSSVFDFEGDGQAEVIYGDEYYLRIYRGTDGQVLYELLKGSATTYEYPLIVDVDADGNAEIVAVANSRGQNGIYVIGDANDTWVSTRQIWNQHTYHITNVNDDGTIPTHEQNSWEVYNTYRLNTLSQASSVEPLSAPNLTTCYVRPQIVDTDVRFTVRIGNGGAIHVPAGVDIAFYDGNPNEGGTLLGVTQTTQTLEPGHFEDVSMTIPLGTVTDLWIRADDDGTGQGQHRECNEDDNLYNYQILGYGEIRGTKFKDVNSNGVRDLIAPDRPFNLVRIGDVDGFGFDPTGLLSAQGTPVDTNGNGLIEQTEFLPDLNQNGYVAWGNGDNFDHRSPSEQTGNSITGAGYDDNGTNGSQWTDIALSTDFPFPNFPDPTGTGLPNEPRFEFRFSVPKNSISENAQLFFNVVFGDYDVVPAQILVTRNDGAGGPGSILTLPLSVQPADQDGLVQSAYSMLNFADVFNDGGNVWIGYLDVELDAPNEPYTAFDYVELSLDPISPEPGSYEPGLSDWVIYLDQNNNGQLNQGEHWVITDGNGNYIFTGLPGGEYYAREAARRGWQQTAPAEGVHVVTIADDQVVEDVDFGNVEADTTINDQPYFSSDPITDATTWFKYIYRSRAIDPDGDPLTYDLPVAPEGMAVHPELGVVAWIPTADQIGTHQVVLRAKDDTNGVALQAFQVEVSPANIPPVIVSTPNLQAVADLPYQYTVIAQDPEGEIITYGLAKAPAGMTINSANGVVSWIPTVVQVGIHEVIVSATDERGAETLQAYDLEVLATAPNDPPAIVSTPRTRVRLGNIYGYWVHANDPNGDPLTYSLIENPAGMTIESQQGIITWIPSADQFGTHPVQVQVSDGRGGVAEQSYTIQVTTSDSNTAPTITSDPKASAVVGQLYAYDLIADDPDGDPVAWSLIEAPLGVSINEQLGTLRWTSTLDQLGSQTITIEAMDPFGATDQQTFDITVRSTNIAPQILSVPPTQATVDQPYTYAVRAQDVEGDVLAFSLTTAPAAMSIDPETGIIEWTPTIADVGDHAVSILVDDGNGGQGTQSYTLVVAVEAINQAPTITSRPKLNAPSELLYEYQVTAIDPEGGVIEYYLLESPAGMTIDRDTGLIQWTPAVDQDGDHTIHIAAIDTEGAAGTQRYTLGVAPNQPPTINSTAPTSVTAGMTYRYAVMATDPEGDDLTYHLIQGPAGLTLNTFGLMNWQTEAADLGSYEISVEVRDPAGASDSQTYTLTVAEDTTAPVVTLTASGSLADPGDSLTFRVRATDNVGLESVVLLIDGQMHTLDFDEALYRTDITFETPGLYDVVARAADVSGNQGFSETLQVRVFDPADNAHPVVIIHSPEYQAMITYLTDVVISVHDDNLAYWKVEYAPANKVDINQLSTDDPDYILLAEGTEPLDNEVATVFDPTILANDAYVMRVTAYDVNGTGWVEPLPFGVSGNAKLGNFTFTVSDVSIPLVGIPITINRTYDTLQAGKLGDFGYGWSLGFADANIGETTPAGQEMQPGDRVYLTDPYGQRVGFTYEPTYQSAWFFGLITYPAFTPDPGVTSTVTVKEGSYGVGGILGSFGGNWNPSQYILTLADGTIYEYIQNQGLQKITDRNGNVVSFTLSAITHSSGAQIDLIRNPQGRIVEIIDPAGNPLKYTYDAAGDLLGFTNQIDETITYEYLSDPAHFLDAIYNTEGTRIFKAEFDEDGRLSSGTDALGNVTQQDFDTAVMMGTITDAGGNVTELYYDERGNVLRKIEPAPNPGIPRPITLYSYDDPMNPDRPTSITGPDGIVKYLTYDGQGNKIKEGVGDDTWFYTYDDFGNMVSETDPEGNISLHQYDGKGNLVAEVDASGFSTLYSRDEKGNLISVTDPDGRLTRFEYNELGQGIRMMEPSGLEWSYSYNFNGEATDISYTWQNPDSPLESFVISTQQVFDHSGQLVERIDETGIRTNAEYDGNGNVITFVDEKGNVSSFIYNSRDELVQESYADGNIRRKVYDKFGRVEYETDYFRLGEALPNGTRNYYDALGRITTVERLEDVLIDLITLSDGSQNTIFLSSGEVISSRSSSYDYGGRLISSIDERGGTTLYEYDYAGRLRVMIDPLHNRTEYQYDKAGRKVLEIDALGRQTQFVYDNKGQLFRTVFHDGTWIEKAYDPLGRVVCEIDQDGEERTFEYNTQDNITAVILSPVIDSELGVEVQPRYEYQYDVYGNLKSIRDPKGRTTYYTYDQFGRQLTCTLPDGQIEIFGYNAYDEIIRHIDFDGRVREYVYDELGRETERRISANESNAAAGIYQQIVTTSYDNFGRRHLVQDSQYGSLEFDYNVDNQLTQITSQEGIINYEYNATTGDRIRIYSDYTDIRYSYDVMGRLETVTAVSAQGQILTSPQVTTYRYTPIGMIDSIELPNGCLTQYTYNDLDRLVNLTNLDPQGGVLSSYEYTLAPDGQRLLSRETRLEEDESVSAVEIEWDYDALDRLIRESSVVLAGQLPERSYTKEYIYDIVGNRIKMATTQAGLTEFKDYFYNDNDQLLSKVSSLGQTTLYQYDHCGNLLSKEVDGATIAEHSYGANGLLETASAYETTLEGEYKKVVARYVYDADGNRVSQTEEIYIDNLLSETVESVYLMDRLSPTGVVQVLEQRDDSGIPTRTYIAGDDIVAQIRVAPDGNQEILYFGYDGLGSTRLLLGSTGEIQYRYDFDAYGNSLGFESRDAGTTLLFAGEHYDTSSLLYYLRNRLYDESIGRFTQPDPYTGEAEIPLSLHKYIYVQNNPIMFTDPLGLWPEPTPMGIGRKVHKEIFDDFDAKFPERIEGWSDRAIITILWDCGIPNLNVLNALKRPDLVTKPKGNNPGYVWEIKPGGLTLGFWAAQGSIELYGLYLWSLNSAAANAMASIWWGPGWYAVYKPPSPVVVYGIPYNVWQIGGMIFYSNTAVTSIQLAGVLAIIDAILTAMSISQNVAPAYATVGG